MFARLHRHRLLRYNDHRADFLGKAFRLLLHLEAFVLRHKEPLYPNEGIAPVVVDWTQYQWCTCDFTPCRPLRDARVAMRTRLVDYHREQGFATATKKSRKRGRERNR